MKYTSTALLFISICFSSIAQNVGIGTSTPNPNAILDIYSTKQGLLPTRINLVQTDLSNPLLNHVQGMITYNTYESQQYTTTSVHDGLYYNDGNQWNLAGPNSIMFGDLKYSLTNSDHSGWYLLDGRNITSLPNNAKNNAIALGFSTNLYNINDCFIKTKTVSESIGSIDGNNQILITQTNLPNIIFNGTTNVSGEHNHEYSDEYSPTQTLGLATNVLALLPLINVTVGRPELVSSNIFSTAPEGNHNHTVTVNSGGSNTPIDATPLHVVTNVFIYLGE